jgi:hypothetical protein
MTEAEWLESADTWQMLEYLESNRLASERKLRQFAAACCHRVECLFSDQCLYKAVYLVESCADGLIPRDSLAPAHAAALDVEYRLSGFDEESTDLRLICVQQMQRDAAAGADPGLGTAAVNFQ